jgi:hypothetical protein
MNRTKEGRSTEIDELWQRTSYLITHARWLEAMVTDGGSRGVWRSAAQWAERLAELLWDRQVEDEGSQQQVSAASCYAKAGDFDRAVVLLEDLLARPSVPEAWRKEAVALLPHYQEQMRQEQESRMRQPWTVPADTVERLGHEKVLH